MTRKRVLLLLGVPDGIRTRVTAVKGRCPRPLDDGDSSEGRPKATVLTLARQPSGVKARMKLGVGWERFRRFLRSF